MSFSVFINSQYANDENVFQAVGDYNLDWSIFELGEYEFSFSFEQRFPDGETVDINFIPHALSLPDLPLKNMVCPIQGRSQSSPAVGLIQFVLNSGGQQIYNNPNNKHVICNRPSSQNFRVRFLGQTGEELARTAEYNYTLMLYFKKI